MEQVAGIPKNVGAQTAHALDGKTLKVLAVVEVLTVLLVTALALIAVLASQLGTGNNTVTDFPLSAVHLITHGHDPTNQLMTADEGVVYLLDTGVNALLPCADRAGISLHKDGIISNLRNIILAQLNVLNTVKYQSSCLFRQI
jgi:hypothetical protein